MYDLVIIGGGPGGSTLGAFVAMRGGRVLLLEKERFPRHQIGESLLPATVHGICRLLGVHEELHRAGFQRKRGGTFLWGASPTPWTFTFSRQPDSLTGYAYQVERCKFDAILLANASRVGVEVLQGNAVSEITFSDGKASGVRYTDSSGTSHEVRARFVADAGGNQSSFHRLVGRRVYSEFFRNVALYGYFRDGKRLPAPNSGNILSAAFKDGWFWYIPLSESMTSVGAVVSRDAAEELRAGPEQAFYKFVDRCPIIKEYLDGASRMTEGQYGEFRIRKDYSYCNTAFYKNDLVLIGDAACFVDPVFSTGVHLATYSALLAARSINTALSGTLSSDVCFAEFEQRYRREFSNFYRFVAAFYEMHQDEESYFWAARKILNTQENAVDAFVRLVSGLGDTDEPLFTSNNHDVKKQLNAWFQDRTSEGKGALASPNCDGNSEVKGLDFDGFMPGLSTEITQIQLQAFMGSQRPPEPPLIAGGLIPSRDGLSWA